MRWRMQMHRSCIFNSLNHNSLDIWEWGSNSGNISNFISVSPARLIHSGGVLCISGIHCQQGKVRRNWCEYSDYSDHAANVSDKSSEVRQVHDPSSCWASSIIIWDALLWFWYHSINFCSIGPFIAIKLCVYGLILPSPRTLAIPSCAV